VDSQSSEHADSQRTEGHGPRRRRRWLVVAILSLVVPIALLALLEGGLRLFGYGYSTRFFVRADDFYESNRRFGWRFFPPEVSRPPQAIRLPVDKPADTTRVFIIGGSAAQGYPNPAFSFGRYLEVMLREGLPDRRFEVVNAAMTAVNSHVMAPAAWDCAEREADLLVVYLGHNEVVGPFGAGTVFGGASASRRAIKASLAVKTTRLGQWISSLLSGGGSAEWRGMVAFLEERVTADDPRLMVVYDHFRRNLADICEAGRSRGAGVILCTVPVNLRHCAPFISAHRPGLSSPRLDEWAGRYEQGVAHEAAAQYDQALEHYAACLAIDDRYAGLHFRLGRCYLAAEQPDKARVHFAQARELDALRFRADAAINDAIRQVAAEHDSARLVDVERAFEGLPGVQAGSPGEDLFLDHVHPTYRGNYEIARRLFAAVLEHAAPAGSAAETVAPLGFERCNELLALTHWERLQNAATLWQLTAAAPFTGQLNYAAMRRRQRARREALWAMRVPAEQVLAAYESAIAAAPDDPLLHLAAAGGYRGQGDLARLSAHLAEVKRLLPNEPRIYMNEAMMRASQGDLAAAERAVETYLVLRDNALPGYDGVIELFMSAGDADRAERFARQAVERHPNHPTASMMLARMLVARKPADPAERRRNLAEARDLLEQALARQDEHAGLWAAMGELRLAEGRPIEAQEAFRHAVRLDASLAEAHVQLAGILFRQGDLAQATTHLANAEDLDPQDMPTTVKYAELLCMGGHIRPAAVLLRRALHIAPGTAPVEAKLAWMLATSADPEVRNGKVAIGLAQSAAAKTRGRPAVLAALAAAYAADGRFTEAVAVGERALSDAQQRRDAALAERLADHLARYRNGEALSFERLDRLEGW